MYFRRYYTIGYPYTTYTEVVGIGRDSRGHTVEYILRFTIAFAYQPLVSTRDHLIDTYTVCIQADHISYPFTYLPHRFIDDENVSL